MQPTEDTITHIFSNPFFSYTGPASKNGLNCVFIMRDGTSYEGEFQDSEITGRGTKRFPNGSTYTGDFVQGEFTGQGEYIGLKEHYVGEFANNMRHGRGKLTKGGITVVGTFYRHKLNGECTVYMKTDGIEFFTATFRNNVLDEWAPLQIAFISEEDPEEEEEEYEEDEAEKQQNIEQCNEAASSQHIHSIRKAVERLLAFR